MENKKSVITKSLIAIVGTIAILGATVGLNMQNSETEQIKVASTQEMQAATAGDYYAYSTRTIYKGINLGDIDGDGFVTYNDFYLMRQKIRGVSNLSLTETQWLTVADMDNDGEIDGTDWIRLKSIILDKLTDSNIPYNKVHGPINVGETIELQAAESNSFTNLASATFTCSDSNATLTAKENGKATFSASKSGDYKVYVNNQEAITIEVVDGIGAYSERTVNLGNTLGDVDGDGFLTYNDYYLIKLKAQGKDTNVSLSESQWLAVGDLNNNGRIDGADFSKLKAIILGRLSDDDIDYTQPYPVKVGDEIQFKVLTTDGKQICFSNVTSSDSTGMTVTKIDSATFKINAKNTGTYRIYVDGKEVIWIYVVDKISFYSERTVNIGNSLGDIDGDGFITYNDYHLIKLKVQGKDTNLSLDESQWLAVGDTNNNERIDGADFSKLKAIVKGATTDSRIPTLQPYPIKIGETITLKTITDMGQKVFFNTVVSNDTAGLQVTKKSSETFDITSKKAGTYNITVDGVQTSTQVIVSNTVTFDANGGSVFPSSKLVNYNETYGTLPTPTREGYTFGGWKTSSGTTITSSSTVSTRDNITLIAQWNPISVNVTFNANGGNVSQASKTVYYKQTYGTLPTPTKSSYTFAGWYTSDNTHIESASIVNTNTAHTLTAKWVYNYDTSSDGTAPQLNATQVVKDGKVYVYVDIDDDPGTTGRYSGLEVVGLDDSEGEGVDDKSYDGIVVSDKVYFEVYSNDDYEVYVLDKAGNSRSVTVKVDAFNTIDYYDSDEVTKLLPTDTYISGTYYEIAGAPEKTGYKFDTWQEATTRDDYGEYNYVNGLEDYAVNNKIKMIAVWEKRNYSITYDLAGGSMPSGTTNPSTYNVESQITLNNPVRDGYTFLGWTGSNGSTPSTSVTISRGNTESKSYTANWKKDTYKIIFHYYYNGTDGVMLEETYNYGEYYDLNNDEICIFNSRMDIKPGYHFDGWVDNYGHSYTLNETLSENLEKSAELNEDVLDLYATWKDDINPTISNFSVVGMTTATGWYTEDITLTGTAIDEGSGISYYAFTKDGQIPDWKEIENTSSQVILTSDDITSSGIWYFDVKDFEGNTARSSGLTVKIDKDDPVVGDVNVTPIQSSKISDEPVIYTGATISIDTSDIEEENIAKIEYVYTKVSENETISYNDIDKEDDNHEWVWGKDNNWTSSSSTSSYTYPAETFTPSETDRYVAFIKVTDEAGRIGYSSAIELKDYNVGSGMFTISYNANGGTGTMQPQTKVYDVNLTLRSNSFTPPTGKHFKNWNTKADGTGTAYQAEETYTENTGVTLYAIWEKNEYTITYNNTEGWNFSSANPTTYNVETDTFTLTNPTKTGYIFIGWTGSNGTTPGNVTISKGTIGNLIYNVNGTAKTPTVTFKPNGGTVNQTNKTVTYDSTYGDLPTPIRTGYTFKGWFKESTFEHEVTSATKVENENNHDLYAKWDVDSYTITVLKEDENGITTVTGAGTYNYGQSVTVVATVDNNYMWKEWTSSNTQLLASSGNQAYTFTMPAGDVTLTAKTNGRKKYNITYHNTYDNSLKTVSDYQSGVDCNLLGYNEGTPIFAKPGENFAGWATTPNGAKVYDDKEQINLTRDNGSTLDLYALWIDNIAPRFTQKVTKTVNPVGENGWTNGSVTLTVSAEDPGRADQVGKGIAKYSFDGGITWKTDNWETYDSCATGIDILIKDAAENTNRYFEAYGEFVDITNIDKHAPKITKKEVVKSGTTVTLNVTTDDEEDDADDLTSNPSGVYKIELLNSLNETNVIQTRKITTSSSEIKNLSGSINLRNAGIQADTTYYLRAYDRAGNTTTTEFSIDKDTLDVSKPVLSVTGESTNAGIKINVNATDDLSGLKTVIVYQLDSVTGNYEIIAPNNIGILADYTNENSTRYLTYAGSITISRAGKIKVEAYDKAGNGPTESYIDFTVANPNIDASAPEVTVSYLPTLEEWTNGNTVVKMTANEPIQIPNEEWEYEVGTDGRVIKKTYTSNTNGIETFTIKDLYTNSSTVEVNVTNIDKTVPEEVRITPRSTNWTQGGVILDISAVDNQGGSGISTLKISKAGVDLVEIAGGETTYTVSTNGVYAVTATDLAGNTKQETVTINCIDNSKPVVEVSKYQNENNETIFQIKATDDLSGVSKVQIYKNGILKKEYNPENIQVFNENYSITENGSYMVKVTDRVGLVENSEEIAISSYDEVAPVISINYSETGLTKEPVTVTIAANEAIKEVTGWTFVDSKTISKTYIVNTETPEVFDIYDLQGNAAATPVSIFVDNIDTIDPTISVTGYNDNVWSTIKTMNVTSSDNIGIAKVEVIKDGEVKYTSASNNFNYSVYENGVYTFKATDRVGRESSESVTITKIDSYNPVIVDTQFEENVGSVTIKILAIDNESGINSVTVNGEVASRIDDNTYSYTVTVGGEYTIVVTDNVGKQIVSDTYKLYIKNIDTTQFIAEFIYSEEQGKPTKENVKVTINANKEIKSITGENWVITDEGFKAYKIYTQSATESIVVSDYNGNSITKTISVNIDKTKPDVNVSYSTREITKDAVVVTLRANEQIQEIENWNLDETKTILTKTIYANTNGNEQITVKDIVGNEETVTYNVSNIDKTAPTLNVSYSTIEATNDNVKVTISANEKIQKPTENTYNDWELSADGTSVSRYYTINANELVTIKDLAGNPSQVRVNISNIDTEELRANVSYIPNEIPTNGNVTATITASKQLQALEGWTLSEDKTVLTKVFEENTNTSCTIKDLAGNTKQVNIVINNIDKTSPTGSVSYSATNSTNNCILATITASEEILNVVGWNRVNANTISKLYYDNVTETIEIFDLAGNKGYVHVEINNYDNSKPNATITYTPNKNWTNGSVVATITANEELQGLDEWELSADHHVLTKRFDDNFVNNITIKDLAGNETNVMVDIQCIDKNAPTETKISVIDGTKKNNDWYETDVLLLVKQGEDLESGLLKTTYKITKDIIIDGVTTGKETGEEIIVRDGIKLKIVEDGIYSIDTYTYDLAGNVTKSTESLVIKRDTKVPTSPTLTINGTKNIGTGWYTDGVTIDVVPGTDSESGVDKVAYVVNDGNEIDVINNVIEITEDGEYVVKAYTIDRSGKYSDAAEVSFKLDKNAPVINITDNTIKTRSSSVIIDIDANDETSGIKGYKYQIKYGNQTQSYPLEDNEITTESEHTFTGLPYSTPVEVSVMVMDNAGNTITMKNTDLSTTELQPEELVIKTGNDFAQDYEVGTWTNKDTKLSFVVPEGSIYESVEGSSIEIASTNQETVINQSGVAYVKVTTTDGTNTVQSGAYVIKVDKDLPTIDKVEISNTEWTKEPVIISVKGADDITSGLAEEAYSFDEGESWQEENYKEYTENAKDIEVWVKDVAGNIYKSEKISIENIDNTPPTVTKPNVSITRTSITVENRQEDTGSGIAEVIYGIRKDPLKQYVWQENPKFEELSDGTYYVKTKATDNLGNTSESEETKVDIAPVIFASTVYDIYNDIREIRNISPNTTVKEFRNNIIANVEYYIADKDNNRLAETDIVGTGMKVIIPEENIIYTNIVTGDLNGDGQVTIGDLARIKKNIIGLNELDELQTKAGDINGDDKIDISDLSKIVKAIIGLIKL